MTFTCSTWRKTGETKAEWYGEKKKDRKEKKRGVVNGETGVKMIIESILEEHRLLQLDDRRKINCVHVCLTFSLTLFSPVSLHWRGTHYDEERERKVEERSHSAAGFTA
ncbi:hypothetical protein NQZ68_016255 [Dissostichus eleginoides]|nr:hypothetical protein NQZ68_016255 [Dissostichus eleginoides]